MNIAINTDFTEDINSPEQYIRLAAEAGFTHMMWCHQWNTDFLYSKSEIAEIKKWFRQYNIALQDIHGSCGMEKSWFATEEYRRAAGVELVLNRIQMLKELDGTGVLIMHPPRINKEDSVEVINEKRARAESLRRSLDELMPALEKYDCCIALENLPRGTWEILTGLLDDYPAERIGFCFDSGHSNISVRPQFPEVEKYADRIMAVHLHDNDGSSDQHLLPFAGTLDWQWVASVIKKSPYRRPLNFEVSFRKSSFFNPESADTIPDQRKYLAEAMERGSRFARMCE